MLVDVDVSDQRISVEQIHFAVTAVPTADEHWWVVIDNRSLTSRVQWQAAAMVGPFPGRWIDMDDVEFDIEAALAIAHREGDGSLLDRFAAPGDLQVDLVLSPGDLLSEDDPSRPSCLWKVSYDAWTESGPKGFLAMAIDARTGEVVGTLHHR